MSIVALLAQLTPLVNWYAVLSLLDLRNWTSHTWFWANALLFLSMFVVRFGPGLRSTAVAVLSYLAPLDTPGNVRSEEETKQRKKDEKALYQRMIEARKRQVI